MKADDEPDGWRSWPSERRVAKELALTPEELQELAGQWHVSPYRGSDGCIHYRPADVEDLRVALEQKRARVADDPLVRALKQATDHAERLMRLITEPMRLIQEERRALLGAQQAETVRLIERVAVLEATRDQNMRTREDLLNETHVRALAAAQVERSDARKDKLLAVLQAKLPGLVDQIGASIAEAKVLRSLSDDQVEVVTKSGLLQPEQVPVFLAAVHRARGPSDKIEPEQETVQNGKPT